MFTSMCCLHRAKETRNNEAAHVEQKEHQLSHTFLVKLPKLYIYHIILPGDCFVSGDFTLKSTKSGKRITYGEWREYCHKWMDENQEEAEPMGIEIDSGLETHKV
ncbi:hypothetical protein WISP_96340 [Willisornis vidua]|uniref:Uncharacterized protein n=1 Tax=Willisornis vidua TaxID=1566151 RepID=A0ABQ9CZV4_9PASS|nr:hypothetical protein WISP_96340 [Willisornis vidua]